ncbi:sigma-70 family RNA polymerase sigma factor [Enterococcus faecalis]|uniref:sigma-70 family RNA polymerase sigma factor n=1 Tax=Enterococcus faecalis TaxID=1351 RepID=UPI0012B4CE4E|nr:hypothetical protein GIR35_14525 [Enterococcus faecalis]
MCIENKKEAAAINFFNKVIKNTRNNFYNKNKKIWEKEILDTSLEIKYIQEDIPKTLIKLLNEPYLANNKNLENFIHLLNEKEKFIIVEKVVYGKTDNEIAVELGVSRQAITNIRKRLSNKFYKNKKL